MSISDGSENKWKCTTCDEMIGGDSAGVVGHKTGVILSTNSHREIHLEPSDGKHRRT